MRRVRLIAVMLAISVSLAVPLATVATPTPALAHSGCGLKHGLASGAHYWTNPATGTSHHAHWAMAVEDTSNCAQIRYAMQMWCDYGPNHTPAGCDYDADNVGIATKAQSNAGITYPWGTIDRHQDGGTSVVFLGSWHTNNPPTFNSPFPSMAMRGALQWRFKIVEPDHLTNRYCDYSSWHSMIHGAYAANVSTSDTPCDIF
jgi:hypothetical protein